MDVFFPRADQLFFTRADHLFFTRAGLTSQLEVPEKNGTGMYAAIM